MNSEFNNSNQVEDSSLSTNNDSLNALNFNPQSSIDKKSKDKKPKKIIIIIIFVLLFISIVSFIFIFNKTGKVLLYVNSDKELKYITTTNKTGVLAKQFEGEIDAKYNSSRDKILYVKDRNLYLKTIKDMISKYIS